VSEECLVFVLVQKKKHEKIIKSDLNNHWATK